MSLHLLLAMADLWIYSPASQPIIAIEPRGLSILIYQWMDSRYSRCAQACPLAVSSACDDFGLDSLTRTIYPYRKFLHRLQLKATALPFLGWFVLSWPHSGAACMATPYDGMLIFGPSNLSWPLRLARYCKGSFSLSHLGNFFGTDANDL